MICKTIIGGIATCLFAATVATADPVGYYTVGVFSSDSGGTAQVTNASSTWALTPGGSGLSTATFIVNNGTNTLEFMGVNSTGTNGGSPVVTPPATISLGAFFPVPASFLSGGVSNFSNVDFDLSIYQTDPLAGTNGYIGEITGALGFSQSMAKGGSLVDTLVWTPNQTQFSIVSGGITDIYTLGQVSYDLNQISNLVLTANLAQTPEPANLLLLGTGLLLAAGVLRRRFS